MNRFMLSLEMLIKVMENLGETEIDEIMEGAEGLEVHGLAEGAGILTGARAEVMAGKEATGVLVVHEKGEVLVAEDMGAQVAAAVAEEDFREEEDIRNLSFFSNN